MAEAETHDLKGLMDIFQVKAELPDDEQVTEREASPMQQVTEATHSVKHNNHLEDNISIQEDDGGFILVGEDDSPDESEINVVGDDDPDAILHGDAAEIQAAFDAEPRDLSNLSTTMDQAMDRDSVTSSSVLYNVLSQGASPTMEQLNDGSLKKRFDCRWCKASFTKKTSLRRHMNLHNGTRPFKCPFCEYNATRKDQLKTHIKTRHTRDSSKHFTFKCPLCSNLFQSQKRMTLHMRSHQWDNFPCDQCHIKFKSANELVQHLKRRHPSPGKDPNSNPYVCGVCHLWCQTIEEYVDHIQTHPQMPNEASSTEHFESLDSFDLSVDMSASTSPARAVRMSILEQELSRGKQAQSRNRYGSGSSNGSQLHHRTSHMRPTSMVPLSSASSTYHAATSSAKSSPHSQQSVLSSLLHGNNMRSSPIGSSNSGPYITKTVSLHDSRDVLRCPQYPMTNHSPMSTSSSSRMPSNVVSPTISRDSRESLDTNSPQLSSNSAASRPTTVRMADTGTQDEVMRCEHCRIIFADSIMYAIHMGCHDWQEPFRCNICAFHCADRYEFMSHITRGLHQKKGR